MDNDLISREALRKAFHERIYYFNKSSWDEANSLIDKAPTVEERSQGEWIPVSERLPDKNGECLVSLDFGDVNIDAFVDGIFVCYLGNVIAWQPLPEPYKEGDK